MRDYNNQLLRCHNETETNIQTYKQYSKEYKEESVDLIREQGYSVPEAAKSLDIASNMRYRWKEQIE